ncbi:MAG: hypothetical protein GEU75_06560 [Dehalococcoidia bacterium]|nr:hypothetical protein [Dehalococcoidia bacterium]
MSIESRPNQDLEAEDAQDELDRRPFLDDDARRWDQRRRDLERRRAAAVKRSAGPPAILTVILTVLALFTLTGYQVTTETAASRLLGRLGASLIELDRWLPEHREDIELQARDRPEATVRPGDLPIELVLPSAAVLEAIDAQALDTLLLDTIGHTLYTRSTGAFRNDEGERQALGIDEPVRWTVQALDEGRHSFWRAALPITLLVLLAPVAGVLLAGRSPLTPIAIGAGISAALCLAAWFLTQTLAGFFDAAVDKETMLILRDGAWIGLRNSLAVTVTAAALTFLLSTLLRPRARRHVWEPTVTPDSDTF